MARIRTIKPEFPQSESIGNLSRDARLLFIQLWTVVDDDGRARAPSRMLASLLYPYDDDAPGLICDWLDELERTGCIRRYSVDGHSYLDIPKWLEHQKIDHKRESKLPAYSDEFATIREASRTCAPDLDQGPRTKEGDATATEPADAAPPPENKSASKKGTRIAPTWTVSEAGRVFARSRGMPEASIDVEAAKFRDHWLAKAGKDGVKLDWEAAWRTWVTRACEWAGWAPVAEASSVPPASIWLPEDDPRWCETAERVRAETGKRLTANGTRNQTGTGAYVPVEWVPDRLKMELKGVG